MSFARFASRTLFAGFFLADGVDGLIRPSSRVEDAQPLAQAWKKAVEPLPKEIAERIPTEPETLVRLHGALQALGALMFATGIGRRIGAAILVATYVPKVIAAQRRYKIPTQLPFLREVALLGAAILATFDTQGKPAWSWVAAQRRQARIMALLDASEPVRKRTHQSIGIE